MSQDFMYGAIVLILILILIHLREFALCYERHPESVRTVSKVFAAGCDSVSAASGDSADASQNRWFFSGIP